MAQAVDSNLKHDPTEPFNWLKPMASKKSTVKKRLPQLQAINCSDADHCYAVLDNQSVEKGDRVSGYILLSVNEESVSICRLGNKWQLSLFSSLNITK